MDLFQAIVIAILQGLTEFLPISSSAHLILLPELLGWSANGLLFDVAVHVGTLFAVLAFLHKEIKQIVPAWISGWNGYSWNTHGVLGWWVIAATIPVGIVGLLAGDYIEANLRTPMIIAGTTLLFGLLLGGADSNAQQNERQLPSLTLQHAVWVGIAQVFALIPGTSRSGVTMTAMLALGYNRLSAARFSFLMAVPAIALPGLLKANELMQSSEPTNFGVLLTALVASGVVAFLTMHWFMRLITKIGMMPFVIYRVLLAGAILLLLT